MVALSAKENDVMFSRMITGALLVLTFVVFSVQAEDPEPPLSLIVMDPLAAPLSCPCVEGYAQRKYEVLAEYLEQSLGCDVKLTFGESFGVARKKAGGAADIIIGKDSVVRSDLRSAKIRIHPLGYLTDMQGSTVQHGMIVVNREDPAKKVQDLGGYTIIFGPSESDEKHSAAVTLLQQSGVSVPKKLMIDDACSDGACKVLDLGPKSKTAAVISSYAQPLLEGCGTIRKGDLRVVAKTAPVPFITAFGADSLDKSVRNRIRTALLDLAAQPGVLDAMESLVGFVPSENSELASTVTKKK